MVPRCALLEWRTVAADPVVADIEAVKRAVEHCNADHADAVLEMSRAFTGLSGIQKAVMLSNDQYGFDVLCETRPCEAGCFSRKPSTVHPSCARL